MSESQLFIAAVYKADLSEIYRVLRRTSVHPYTCKDSRGHSAMHIASLNANLSIINFLTDFVRFYSDLCEVQVGSRANIRRLGEPGD